MQAPCPGGGDRPGWPRRAGDECPRRADEPERRAGTFWTQARRTAAAGPELGVGGAGRVAWVWPEAGSPTLQATGRITWRAGGVSTPREQRSVPEPGEAFYVARDNDLQRRLIVTLAAVGNVIQRH